MTRPPSATPRELSSLASPGFELVAEATSGEEAVDLVDKVRPGVVLMDINMGVMDGLEATRLITTAHPETMVILVSTYTEADMPPDRASVRRSRLCQQGRALAQSHSADLGGRRRSGMDGSRA